MFVTPRPVSGHHLPGRQPLSREFIVKHQRARIIDALAKETEDRGYHAVTVAHIVSRAGIARNTFYENFSSKEDCFLAAQDLGTSEARARVIEAAAEFEDWPERVEAGLAAFLRYAASEPALARICIVESLSAGEPAVERREESLKSFVSLFRSGRDFAPQAEVLPTTLEEAIVGGIFWIVYDRIVTGKVEAIEGLFPELVQFVLIPYLGREAAWRVATGGTG
jgi:AcrR family transcriptional regulator